MALTHSQKDVCLLRTCKLFVMPYSISAILTFTVPCEMVTTDLKAGLNKTAYKKESVISSYKASGVPHGVK